MLQLGILFVLCFLSQPPGTDSLTRTQRQHHQSAAQACLSAQQITVTEEGLVYKEGSSASLSPEEVTLEAFKSICSQWSDYAHCLWSRLPASPVPADRLEALLTGPEQLEAAYRGLCSTHLDALQDKIHCLLNTKEVEQCYDEYSDNMRRMASHEDFSRWTEEELGDMACNTTVSRFHCETAAYATCHQVAGDAMRSFFFATLTPKCRALTGVTSAYLLSAAPPPAARPPPLRLAWLGLLVALATRTLL